MPLRHRRYRAPVEPITTKIEVTREAGDSFSAKLIPTPWSESHYWASGPMPWRDLVQALSQRGQHSTDITDAFDAAGIPWPPDDNG
jgi:hypothetical protein